MKKQAKEQWEKLSYALAKDENIKANFIIFLIRACGTSEENAQKFADDVTGETFEQYMDKRIAGDEVKAMLRETLGNSRKKQTTKNI